MQQPYVLDLAAGDHYICSCAKSKNMPFCDGTHQGTTSTPNKVTLDAPQTIYVCGCGRTGNQPFCDGTHKL